MAQNRSFFDRLFGSGKSKRRRSRSEAQPNPGTQRLARELEKGAHSVSLRRLRKAGMQTVRVIDATQIQGIVGNAVDEALRLRKVDLSLDEREQVRDMATAQLRQLMEENQRLSQEKDTANAQAVEARAKALAAEEEHEQLEASISSLRQELEKRQGELQSRQAQLAKEKARKIVVEITEESFEELERRLKLILERMLRDQELVTQDGETITLNWEEINKEVGQAIHRLVDTERKKQGAAPQEDEKVEFLEKRIGKLNKALEDAEGALRKLALMKGMEPGIASIYAEVQGLNFEDPDFERKSELLTEVFKENLALQGVDEKEEEEKGSMLSDEGLVYLGSDEAKIFDSGDEIPPASAPSADGTLALPPGFEPPDESLIGETGF